MFPGWFLFSNYITDLTWKTFGEWGIHEVFSGIFHVEPCNSLDDWCFLQLNFFGSTKKESTRLSRMSRSYKTILIFSQFNGYMYIMFISQLDLSPPTTATMKYHCNAGVPNNLATNFSDFPWLADLQKTLLTCCFLGKRNKKQCFKP